MYVPSTRPQLSSLPFQPQAADLSFAGITMLPLTNRRPELLRYHLQQLSSSSKFTALSA